MKNVRIKTINVVEIFMSIQGEGKYVGVPSIFVRVFGCNATCPGFGQERGKLIKEEQMPHNMFDVDGVETLKDVPIFSLGCDSSAAWSKKYRKFTTKYTADELVSRIAELTPKMAFWGKMPHVVFTGGEPLLPGFQEFWAGVIEQLERKHYHHITFETNGTQILGARMHNAIIKSLLVTTFSVSPKLSLSGEPMSKMLKPKALSSYYGAVDEKEVYLKFVIRDGIDIIEIDNFLCEYQSQLWEDFASMVPRLNIYLMPEGATSLDLTLTEYDVAMLAVQHGYNYSPRLHCGLFKNKWGT